MGWVEFRLIRQTCAWEGGLRAGRRERTSSAFRNVAFEIVRNGYFDAPAEFFGRLRMESAQQLFDIGAQCTNALVCDLLDASDDNARLGVLTDKVTQAQPDIFNDAVLVRGILSALYSGNTSALPDIARRHAQDMAKDATMTFDLLVHFYWISTTLISLAATAEILFPSAEFRVIHQRFCKDSYESWARTLLESGPWLAKRTGWRVADAWDQARNKWSTEEHNRAVRALAELRELSFEVIEPQSGSPFDAEMMESVLEFGGGYVWRNLEPGLRQNAQVLEKARVENGTEDYWILRQESEQPLTRRLFELTQRDLGPCYQFDDQGMARLVFDCAGSLEACGNLDRWLDAVLARSTLGHLRIISVTEGAPFDVRTMDAIPQIADAHNARVTRVLHRGLARAVPGRPEVLLLKAGVQIASASFQL